MSDQVRVEYEQMTNVASRFAKQADAVQHLLQVLVGKLDPLRNGSFKGEAATSFYAEMDNVLLPAVQKLQALLTESSATTKEAAQIFRQADQEASSRFKNYA